MEIAASRRKKYQFEALPPWSRFMKGRGHRLLKYVH
jgi:hypothetical protein